ncbi:hypothetical protein CLV99_2425 [Sphingobacterium yanglingense]|uniref:Uncharacterized protein n=1 Tax=Sphingobacterium yanglingense TaxID=1437280 RepID=A0A4R6WLZ5_9SPHI|nr:hypothetical protein CLV99_2425 [Sphingobacterium yanglingense]
MFGVNIMDTDELQIVNVEVGLCLYCCCTFAVDQNKKICYCICLTKGTRSNGT